MRPFFPSTLGLYLAKSYLKSFLQLLGILLAIVYLFDTVELLRRAAKFSDVPFTLVLQMGLLKLPDVGQVILPFAVLFGALYTFWSLSRKQELVSIRAAGLSVWQFLSPMVIVAVSAGLLHMAVINPVGAMMISRYQVLESRFLEAKDNTVAIGQHGLWLRQKSADGSDVIMRADKVKMPAWELTGVSAFFFTRDGSFDKRYDAAAASLKDGFWEFSDVYVTTNTAGQTAQRHMRENLSTNLTTGDIEESFSTPEQTPFWSLPGYIQTMESTGFDSRKLRIHLQSLMAQPMLFAAMVFLAATVSLRSARQQPTGFLIAAGAVMGFIVFFAASFLKALGASDQIPVAVAAWFPPLIALILGISVILTTEDG